ncbi:OmpA family protein [Oxalobacteraceae bacterium]|nr:OmpA family protein [Oxalobacteraceae bacterium]
MKKLHFIPAVFALSVLMAACSSTPTTTSLLDQTRGDYAAAQNNPAVATYAANEFRQAGEALDAANAAAAKKESLDKIDKLAYLARQKIATAGEVARQKAAEADVANAGKQRDQIRLEQRTQEADMAKSAADRARLSAEQAKRQADAANSQAANAEAATRDAQARAAALESQLADLQAKKTERGIIITFSDVLFNVDKAELSAEGLNTARKLADVLNQNPQAALMVEGFTDSTGSASHNLELSQRRAEAVRAALSSLGVARERIATRGYGEAYPVAGNDTAGNRQLNRRVEIVLSQSGAPIANRR